MGIIYHIGVPKPTVACCAAPLTQLWEKAMIIVLLSV